MAARGSAGWASRDVCWAPWTRDTLDRFLRHTHHTRARAQWGARKTCPTCQGARTRRSPTPHDDRHEPHLAVCLRTELHCLEASTELGGRHRPVPVLLAPQHETLVDVREGRPTHSHGTGAGTVLEE